MDYDWIWKSFAIVLLGSLILRIAGRKSIAQMTVAQTIIMVAVGSLLIQPFSEKDTWTVLAISFLFILILIVMEYAQIKFDIIEKLISGTAKPVIRNGQILEKNLKILRLPIDQLEKHLRQEGISNIADVKNATIESSGQLGYELYDYAKPATKKDIEELKKEINQIIECLHLTTHKSIQNNTYTLFDEVYYEKHENSPPPNHLQ